MELLYDFGQVSTFMTLCSFISNIVPFNGLNITSFAVKAFEIFTGSSDYKDVRNPVD